MQDHGKRLAARAALSELPEAGFVGLGTGSTARFVVEGVAELIRAGRRLSCVCTSAVTRAQATSLGIPLLPDEGPWEIDVTIDGADEVADSLDLSKGAGGALTREKMVAHASRRLVIVCDRSKRVRHLGERAPVSIEILPFGHATTLAHLQAFGEASLRPNARTDNGNLLVDIVVGSIEQPGDLDERLRTIPGVVETGLFIGRADVVLVGDEDRVEKLLR